MSSQELVHIPISIPPELQKAGVQVVDQGGVRAVAIPPGLEQTYNIVQPVSEIAATDPDWTPRFVVVNIDPTLDPPKGNARESYGGKHVYVQDKMLALRKEAILLLAYAAGIDIQVQPMERARLGESEIGYEAVATMRRSDGTLASWPGTRMVDKDVERERVKASCFDRKTGEFDAAYFAKRWGTELDHLRAKVESKAMLRAVVNLLQLKRGGYTDAELRKPFLIVGWSSTPSDPEVRRERALAAAGAVYGKRALAPVPDLDAEPAALPAPADVVDDVPAAAQTATAPPPPPPASPPSAPPATDEFAGEPPPPSEPVAGEIPHDVATAGAVQIQGGKRDKKTIAELAVNDHAFLVWMIGYTPPEAHEARQRPIIEAARTYLAWFDAQGAAA